MVTISVRLPNSCKLLYSEFTSCIIFQHNRRNASFGIISYALACCFRTGGATGAGDGPVGANTLEQQLFTAPPRTLSPPCWIPGPLDVCRSCCRISKVWQTTHWLNTSPSISCCVRCSCICNYLPHSDAVTFNTPPRSVVCLEHCLFRLPSLLCNVLE